LYPLDSARASSSSAVAFLFIMMAEKAAVGRARKGAKERDRTSGHQTERVGGRRRRRRRKKRG
jgi:hypothetical protein